MKNKIAFYAKFLTVIALMPYSCMVHAMARTGVRLAGDAFAGKTFGSSSAANADLAAAQKVQAMDAQAAARRTQEAANQLAHRVTNHTTALARRPMLADQLTLHPAAATGSALTTLPEYADQLIVSPATTTALAPLVKYVHPAATAKGLISEPAADATMMNGPIRPSLVDRFAAPELYEAAQNGDVAAIERLLQLGASPNEFNPEQGLFPLNIATYEGHAEAVDALLKAGANPNAQVSGGDTALHHAINGHAGYEPEIVQKLLQAGARATTRNSLGNTARDNARSKHDGDDYYISPEVSRLLREAEAKETGATKKANVAAVEAVRKYGPKAWTKIVYNGSLRHELEKDMTLEEVSQFRFNLFEFDHYGKFDNSKLNDMLSAKAKGNVAPRS